MTIEYFSGGEGRVLVTVAASELDGYGVSFGSMSLTDPPTRALLRDLLSMVTRMGLRGEGEPVSVDCTSTGEGGCALLISRAPCREYVFESSDDVISAYIAGVLPEGELCREAGRWLFRPNAYIQPRQRRVLNEYCVPGEGYDVSC